MGKILLRVAIWGGKNPSGNLFDGQKLDLSQRVAALEDVVSKAREWLDVMEGIGGETLPELRIFVAPEYLLIKSSTALEDERAVSFDDFKLLQEESRLEKLSKGLLLIPGTVVWKKPALRDGGSEGGGSAPDRLEKLKEQSDRYEERIKAYYKNRSGSVTFVATGEIESFEKKLGKLDKVDRSRAYIARNAAYVYYDGKLLLKYYKQSEYRGKKTLELSSADRKLHPKEIKFIRGYKEGLFKVELSKETIVRCGVEICADHPGQELKYSSTDGPLNLHFILSDQTANQKNSVAVGPGGYVVHASTSSDSSGLFNHALEKAEEAHIQDLKYGRLYCYTQVVAL
jgi:hypothetical protein